MTTPTHQLAAGALAPAGSGLWRAEIIATVKLALPIALTQLGQVAMMTSDLMLVGHLGDNAIAAAALAQIVLFAAFMIGMGVMAAVSPLAAQAYGAREPRMVRRSLRVGLWAAVLLGVPMTALQYGARISCWRSARTTRRRGCRPLSHGTWLEPGAELVVHRLARLHGRGQQTGAGFCGSPWRRSDQCPARLCLIMARSDFPSSICWAPASPPPRSVWPCAPPASASPIAAAVPEISGARPLLAHRLALMGKLIVVGAPIAGAFLLEYAVRHRRDPDGLDRHHRARRASDRAADGVDPVHGAVRHFDGGDGACRHAVGRRDAAGTRRAGLSAIGLAALFMSAMVLLIVAFRHVIPLAVSGRGSDQCRATVALAATLLAFGATFFIVDGIQTVAAGALRGLNDTRVPIDLRRAELLGDRLRHLLYLGLSGAAGGGRIWIGFTVGLGVYACCWCGASIC